MAEIDVYTALANPVRREILATLRQGPCSVNDLVDRFDIQRPAVSEHLQVLRRAEIVRVEPQGRQRVYHLDPRPLEAAREFLRTLTDFWNDRLDALGQALEEDPE